MSNKENVTILCLKTKPIFGEKKSLSAYNISFQAEGKMGYLKVHFWSKTISTGHKE